MLKFYSCAGKYLLIITFCVTCCIVTGCIESSFQLASESRLPKWIDVPPGLTRADISVTMNYYTNPLGADAKFIIKDKNRRIITTVNGKCGGLYHLPLKNPPPGYDSLHYPAFQVITVKSITEIIEHKKMEPIFYVNDDPAVRKELLSGDGIEKK